jgi:hypothetical protein
VTDGQQPATRIDRPSEHQSDETLEKGAAHGQIQQGGCNDDAIAFSTGSTCSSRFTSTWKATDCLPDNPHVCLFPDDSQ